MLQQDDITNTRICLKAFQSAWSLHIPQFSPTSREADLFTGPALGQEDNSLQAYVYE